MEVPLLTNRGEPYVPRPSQEKFHASGAIAKCLLGGMGSGKSLAGSVEVLLQVFEPEPTGTKQGWKGLIARYGWDELESSTWKMFLDIIPDEIKKLSEIRQRPYPQIVFPNGAEVRGMNLKSPERMGSEEFSVAWIDECGEPGVDERFFLWLMGRRRNARGRNQILLTGHPAGRNWVWRRFFAHKEGHPKFRHHEGWIAPSDENIHLDPSYLAMMRATYPADWLSRYLDGDFGVMEGQILDSFDPDIHLVAPFRIPPEWPRYRGIDHGLTHPTTCIWLASDFAGNLVVYREHVKRNITPRENVDLIKAHSKGEEEAIRWTVIDPSTQQQQTAAGVIQRIIDQYREAGLGCRVGNNDIASSITLIKELLRSDPNRLYPSWHHLKGLPGSPRLFISTECPMLRWEIEQWRWMDIRPGQIDRQKVRAENDDCIAGLRYILMERPREAVAPPVISNEEVILQIIADLATEERFGSDYIGAERLTRV